MQVTQHVLGIPVGERDNVVYLISGERALFIDAGYEVQADVDLLVQRWDESGRLPVQAIVVTHRHPDHAGGAQMLADATNSVVAATAVEKPFIEEAFPGTIVGRTVANRESLDLGGVTLEFIHTPGHTMGSICVYQHEEGVLFTGDTVLGTGTTTINPEQGDMGDYIESLRLLMGFGAGIICPGHGAPINEPRAKLQEAIGRRLSREQDILGLISGGARTVEHLFAKLYPSIEPHLYVAAHRQIQAHLVKLERDGLISFEGEWFDSALSHKTKGRAL